MFDKILDSKLFGKNSGFIFIFVIVCIGLYVYNDRFHVVDRFSSKDGQYPMPSAAQENVIASQPSAHMDSAAGYQTKSTTQPHDLLPTDVNSDWAKLNPVGTSDVIGSDLLDSKAFMGQISQYKGIMNYDLRAFPVIEKKDVSPWLQSTYEPDVNRTGIQCTN